MLALCLAVLLTGQRIGFATSGGSATLVTPERIGGGTGKKDARDADLYPAAAHDATTGQYLVIWLSARVAGSSSDGLDVYGVFVGQDGKPVGGEFRISDTNSAARSSSPTVVAGQGEFAVAWTDRGSPCRVLVQRVVDNSSRADRVLATGSSHRHSPTLAYDPTRKRYLLAYVEGDDYLPPTFFGAQTTDCGNNAASSSLIRAVDFSFNGDNVIAGAVRDISEKRAGAFRPRLQFSAGLGQYLAVWEDRRYASSRAHQFDIFTQRLGSGLTPIGGNFQVADGGDYRSFDSSATWTPRPAVAASNSQFLVTWFTREVQDDVTVWLVMARLVRGDGSIGPIFAVAQMPFATSHTGNSPTGFLAASFLPPSQEYLIAFTTHLESAWGYFSFALVQRVSIFGQLLKLDGAGLTTPGVGVSIDYDNDDQLALAIAPSAGSVAGVGQYLLAYGKHKPGLPEKDFDIWAARLRVPVGSEVSPTPAPATPIPTVVTASDGRSNIAVPSGAVGRANTWPQIRSVPTPTSIPRAIIPKRAMEILFVDASTGSIISEIDQDATIEISYAGLGLSNADIGKLVIYNATRGQYLPTAVDRAREVASVRTRWFSTFVLAQEVLPRPRLYLPNVTRTGR